MCILTADVHKVLCLFYEKLVEYIQTEQYGIKCDTNINNVKDILNYYEFQCYSNDYIRNLVIEEGNTTNNCNRQSFVLGIIG